MVWRSLAYADDVPETALVIGMAGTPPAATNDVADFYMVVPFTMNIARLKATMNVAPSADITLQLRRSVDNGVSFSNVTGATVTVLNGAHLGEAAVTPFTVDEGDILNFSITVGGDSGENVALFLIGAK